MRPFRPMLAATFDGQLRYDDYFASPKIDGIRCVIRNGVPVSRTLKPIPNDYIKRCIASTLLEGMDGELIVGEPNHEDVYRRTNSGVMSRAGEPNFSFHVFDLVPDDLTTNFYNRRTELCDRVANLPDHLFKFVQTVPQLYCNDMEELERIEMHYTNAGYEGVMLKRASSLYKFGRATVRQGELLKVKRFEDAEAVILGFEPLMKNMNEAVENALGLTERSSHGENKVAQELLGNLIVRDLETGVSFSIGSGFNQREREEIWADRDSFLGSIVKYQHFPIGRKDLPRFPTFKGLRSLEDM